MNETEPNENRKPSLIKKEQRSMSSFTQRKCCLFWKKNPKKKITNVK